MEEQDKMIIIINFLNMCGISCTNVSELNGMILYRNDLIFSNKYETIKPNIHELKRILRSSIYTSLHSCADKKQKNPFINIIRQVLKSISYKLVPKRISNGYTLDGVKLYKRVFIIEKQL